MNTAMQEKRTGQCRPQQLRGRETFDIGNGELAGREEITFGGRRYDGYYLTLQGQGRGAFSALIMPTALSQAIVKRYYPDGEVQQDVYPDTLVYYYATADEMRHPLALRDRLQQELSE